MYQQVNLADHTLVGAPGPLPANLIGLSDAALTDLSAAIDPPPPGLAGQGFWPVVVTKPTFDPNVQTLDGTLTLGTPDPATSTVPATATLRALTTPELAAALATAQIAAVATLSATCAAQILAGYASSALGAPHTYPAAATDQANMTASVVASLLPGLPTSWTTPFWVADSAGAWSFQAHTAAQIQQAGQDGKSAILAAQTKLAGLKAQVAAATTATQVAAISW